ncbi:hypothetical protein [Sporosarcina cyprini]|uniref:hypothetical protein n=1 Tax=Sporosarcina cyprini TaxID=2910523 RepID=UPI001EDEF57A|nr:hypothetical protein [Sporosarcina cyprini]MCG3088945.1 hypothetical protein [Sporosarcina cyprini]
MLTKRFWGWLFVILGIPLATLILWPSDTKDLTIDKDKPRYNPEEIEVSLLIEGTEEKVLLKRHEGIERSFVIYIDPSRYTATVQDGVDVIKPIQNDKDEMSQRIPEVSLRVEHVTHRSPDELKKEVTATWQDEFKVSDIAEPITTPFNGFRLHHVAGQDWNSEVKTVMILSDGANGSFLVTETLFLEASEGHGARFDLMLQTLEVLE